MIERLSDAGLGPSPPTMIEISVPEVLEGERSELDALIAHYEPVGPVETLVVRDIARQASDMKKWAEVGDAVRRQTLRQLGALESAAASETCHDSALTIACSAEASDRAERYLLAHTRIFYRAIRELEALQVLRKGANSVSGPPQLFRTESDCEAYLSRRFASGKYFCEQCGHSRGFIISRRKAWECGKCHRQTGVRSGTIMSGSQVPLLVWFSAIGWILWRPTVETAELAERIGIKRIGTVRKLANRIRHALLSDDASDRLASLDQYYSKVHT